MASWQNPAVGELLRRHRRVAGLTQEELAERAGLSARTVSDLERGVKGRPHRVTVDLLATALGLEGAERAAFTDARGRSLTPPDAGPGADTGDAIALASTQWSDVLPLLVGRQHELALLERHLTGTGPPVLLLTGEPGIGKSRLLDEAAGRAVSQGWRVLRGGCQRRGGQEPYAPLLAALERHIQAYDSAQRQEHLLGCAWLVRLLPELATGPIEPLPAWTLPPEQERRLMFGAVARYLRNVAGAAGTLLVLDDLQWAGADALDLLGALVRSTTTAGLVRVIAAYRDTEVQPQAQAPISMWLADMAQARLVTRQAVPLLSREDTASLLDALLPPRVAMRLEREGQALRERMFQRTGGVPFFIMSCATAMHLHTVTDEAPDAVPWDVVQSVRQRVAAMPEATQAVLAAAAVVGRVVQLGLLADVTAQSEDVVLAALDVACKARLLVEEVGGHRFVHDVIREVVEADIGVARRGTLHRRVAEALEREVPAPPIELVAYHYAQSPVQEKAAVYLEQAGDTAVAHGALHAAEGYYRDAIARLDRMGWVRAVGRVLEKRGAVLMAAAHYDAALEALARAADTYRALGEVEDLRRVTAQIGVVHTFRGTPAEGLELLQTLLEGMAEDEVSAGLAALYVALANLHFVIGRYADTLLAAERAAAIATMLHDDHRRAEAEVLLGLALDMLGHGEDGLRVTEAALPQLEREGNLLYLSAALHNIGVAYEKRGAFERGRAYAERALGVAQMLGNPLAIAYLTSWYGTFSFLSGLWTEARQYLEQAVTMSGEDEISWYAPYPLLHLGQLYLALGEPQAAEQHLTKSIALAEQTGDIHALRQAQALLAQRDLRAGKPAAARDRLVPLLDRPGSQEHDVTALLPLLAWAYLDLGYVMQADEAVHEALNRARAGQYTRYVVDALWVQGLVAIRQRRWEEAQRILDEALSLVRGMCYPYAEARLLHLYGDMHLQKDEVGLARVRLEAARATFQRLGARKDIEDVDGAIAGIARQ